MYLQGFVGWMLFYLSYQDTVLSLFPVSLLIEKVARRSNQLNG
jgi:hypothetical protein